MNAVSRTFSTIVVSCFLAAPFAAAAPVDGFVATLTVTRENGELVGRYNLLDEPLAQPGRAFGLQNAEEPSDDEIEDVSFFVGDDTLQLIGDVQFKTDPFVQFSFGIANFTAAPLNYFFIFATPYTDGPYDTLTSSLSSSVTDGGQRPNGLVTVDPFLLDAVVDDTTYLSLLTPCLRAGAAGFSLNCPDAMGTTSLFSAATGTLALALSFRLSPRDLVSINGRADLLRRQVAEPMTAATLGVGLIALVALRRGRSGRHL